MYLLYADESGNLAGKDSDVFVVGAVAVHEDAVRPFAGEVNGNINRYLGRKLGAEVEVHGSPLRTGRQEWKKVNGGKRHGLAHALLGSVCDWEHGDTKSKVEAFAVVIDRDFSQSPTETSYAELLYMFDEFLRKGRRGGDPHNGILVADRSSYERTLEAWVEVARARRSRPQGDPRRLYALAETPFFVDSRSTRLMQVADMVAHSMYRAYNADDWVWANSVLPALINDRRNGLLHLTSNADCECPACEPAQPTGPIAAVRKAAADVIKP